MEHHPRCGSSTLKKEGRCHIYRNIIPARCIECGKGTRSAVNVCKDKNCNYQKLRYKKVKEEKDAAFEEFYETMWRGYFAEKPFSVYDVPQFREMLNNETESIFKHFFWLSIIILFSFRVLNLLLYIRVTKFMSRVRKQSHTKLNNDRNYSKMQLAKVRSRKNSQ